MKGGGNIAREYEEESSLPPCPVANVPGFDDFDSPALGIQYYAPRIYPSSFTDLVSRPGWLRMRGQESGSSLNRVSLLVRKLTGVHGTVTTKMEFSPECYQHSAGLILYYDNMNYAYLRKYWSDTLSSPALSVIRVENGVKTDCPGTRTAAGNGAVYLRLQIDGRETRFFWSADGETWTGIGSAFDTSRFSDEFCKYGEFTGTMVGITCADRLFHRKYADFDWLDYRMDETGEVR